jgi:hypothetical protein
MSIRIGTKAMPNRTIYIRADDLEAWDRIKDKPEFIHDAIQASTPYKDGKLPFTTMQFKEDVATLGKVVKTGERLQKQVQKPLQAIQMEEGQVVVGRAETIPKTADEVSEDLNRKIASDAFTGGKKFDYCQHGNIKGLCKKGCK